MRKSAIDTAAAADLKALRRVVLVAAAVVATDTAFYAVITPLLPHYAQQLALSKGEIGLLGAAYSAGVMLSALPAGMLAARIGPRTTMIAAMGVLAAACVVFGFGRSAGVLEAARLLQGAAGSMAWAGAFGWVVDVAPPERRGLMIGRMLSAGVAGTLLGPPVGALAEAVGPRLLFSSVVVLCAAVALASLMVPAPAPARDAAQGVRCVARAVRRPDIALATWLVVLAGVIFGIVAVLGSLRLAHAGAGAFGIAAVFLASAAVELFLNPLIGRVVDRHGVLVPVRSGLAVAAGALGMFALPSTVVLQGAVIVAVMCGTTSMWGPAMTFLSTAGARTGLRQEMVFGLTNLAWAVGSVGGSIGGAAVAGAVGDGAAAGIAAALTAASLGLVLSGRLELRRSPAVPETV